MLAATPLLLCKALLISKTFNSFKSMYCNWPRGGCAWWGGPSRRTCPSPQREAPATPGQTVWKKVELSGITRKMVLACSKSNSLVEPSSSHHKAIAAAAQAPSSPPSLVVISVGIMRKHEMQPVGVVQLLHHPRVSLLSLHLLLQLLP